MAGHIAIIGAGLAGVCMAIQLKREGVDSFTVFERTDEIGGVWRDNTYPGAACDLPAHLYSYSFASHGGWTHNYARQPAILDYVRQCADRFGIRPHIEFGTEIVAAHFDAGAGVWRLRTRSGAEHTARVLVTAVGQLNRPHVPDLPGAGEFAGTSFHSAAWPDGHDVTGRSVAVIGNGCSAVQIVPRIASSARRLHVFQRSPKWIIPKWDRELRPATRSVYDRFPFARKVSRASWFLMAETLAYWPLRGGPFGRAMTAWARLHLRRQVRDPGLRARLTPDFAFGCNRMILSNDYYPALTRDNVELVTDAIAGVRPGGIETADGRIRDVDTIIYATGFHTTRFLAPIEVTGSSGARLAERWAGGASAYLGVAVPGFPNLFLLYGPNTSSANNSVIHMLESQVRYVLGCLATIGDHGTMEVTEAAHAEYGQHLATHLDETVWQGDCRSWYKTDSGRVTALYPLRASRYRRETRRPDLAHFHVRRAG